MVAKLGVMIVHGMGKQAGGFAQGRYGASDFERMRTLAGIATFGCNIPLFSLAYERFVCFKFPDRHLAAYFPGSTPADKLRDAVRWLNFFDPDDVLGYPLRPLGESYRRARIRDLDISAGGAFSAWNPTAHSQYWTDNSFTKPVAEQLCRLLRLL